MNLRRGIGEVDNQDLEDTHYPHYTDQQHLHSYVGIRQQRQAELQQEEQHQMNTTQRISSKETQDITKTTQEQQTQKHMTIHSSEIEEPSQTQTGQQANPRAKHFIQQTLQQYDTTPNKKNESWGASINNLPPTNFSDILPEHQRVTIHH
jgi:hypothetical protein